MNKIYTIPQIIVILAVFFLCQSSSRATVNNRYLTGLNVGNKSGSQTFGNVHILGESVIGKNEINSIRNYNGFGYFLFFYQNLITGIIEVRTGDLFPKTFKLHQNYPNPFNPTTKIIYEIPKATHVELKVYDLLGRTVGDLVDSYKLPGVYAVFWESAGLPSGVYFCTIRAGDYYRVIKLVVEK
ncbi:hypothetical protein CEE37_07160 [candidate division LCP-89 bacterium B3_LCP]|uniref:Secretion system C-terminal sorting domain-containing protein n=1 Tax=candidate division LCP-89 bacterium B3_LCP TaxID=2012998 RepID=A0A532V0J8_UNCL8|nr:MAG: hypothetical protein CEE37_07160 [candidate division LCP-89 bacterium B3_LCP]